MKNFFDKCMALLRQARVWTLLLVLLLTLAIWLIGPLLGFAEYRIWESPTARLTTISLLFLGWGIVLVFSRPRPGVVPDGQADEDRLRLNALLADERKDLISRFRDARRVLTQSSLYAGHRGRASEQLPWYLLIGPQGSGKTSLLDFSGLDFPLNKVERKLTRDTAGSRNCDWYFSNQAVLLDTAGRYFSQTQPQVDAGGWMALLKLLRQRRRARPLNGVLVTLPVEVLLGTDELQVEALAATVRRRLQEVHRHLQIDVPVYLVLSKADAVPGFDEFFDQLSREETEQVLGTTFAAGQNGSDVGLLKQAFDALLARLNSQVLGRLHHELGTRRRGLILEFPQQLGGIGHNLCLFVELAFAGNRYQRATQLRGYYLTRAAHLSPAPEADAAIGDAPAGGSSRLPLLQPGRARFIHDLLGGVIFPESELATLDKDAQRRLRWGQRACYAAAAVILALCGTLWASGFSGNHERLERIRGLAAQLIQQRSALEPGEDLLAMLAPLNTAFEATRVFHADDRWLDAHNGLYQGEATNAVLNQVYAAELQRQLLPRLARQLEAQIKASLADREQLLASLRAYLMLNLTGHRDRAWLQEWIGTDWALRFAGQEQVQGELNGHLQRLLDQPFVQPVDEALVAQARQVLRGESLANVVYRMLRDQARSSPDYRLAQHLASGQGTLFSGTDYIIPGFYTRQGYQQFLVARGSGAVTDILRDNWVLGESGSLSPLALRGLLVELEQLYFRDYANHWSEALGQVALQPFENARQGAAQMAALTAANSGLLQLLVEVREHTRFTLPAPSPEANTDAPAQAATANAGVGKLASAAAAQATQALAAAVPDTARRALQRRFEPLHRLLDEDNGPAADLIPVLQALNDVQQQIAALGRSGQPELAAFEMARSRMSGQRDAYSQLRSSAGRLPQPVSGWFNTLAEDSWAFVLQETYRHLNQRYQDEVYGFYGQALDKRYPFHAHSSSDVALNDFREFFKAQGIADRFFDTYIKPFVTGEPGRYRLRSVDGFGLPMSHAWLEQMSTVHVVRKSFFAHGPDEPQVQFKLEPYTLDPAVSRAEFRLGDQVIEYRHGPVLATPFKWPSEVDDGRAALVLDRIEGRPVGIEKQTGPWSLFRLLDLMDTEYLQGRDVLVLKAEVGGLRANYLLTSQRSPNPFDMAVLRRFRLPAQL
ncbi:type VI secretion system membrane subunit TssM [Pseudomonas sp. R1-18]|uniref:type VI secretion system membrane subunit TssM n=1 Tax=Pseudomonas sp. R1-18 TaxID=1632772 RepID=UPI003DA7A9B0